MKELKSKYKEVFGEYAIPPTLNKLIDFESQCDAYYSECFELSPSLDKRPDMGQYSLDEEYFERRLVFAKADGSGSEYAFWVSQIGMSLEDAPIIMLGSEGHIQVVAKNIKELLQLLSFGPEIMDGTFYKDLEDFEEPVNADKFRTWLANELKVKPIENIQVEESEEVNKIVEEAVKTYGGAFKNWMMSLNPQYISFDKF